jgi:hypothetical protein
MGLRRLPWVIAVAALVAATPPVQSAAPKCPARGVKRLNENRYVEVYRFVAGRHRGEAETCVKATGDRTLLNTVPVSRVLGVPRPAVDHYTVAFDLADVPDPGMDSEAETLEVFDARGAPLADGSKLRQVDALQGGGGVVARLVVTQGGGVAWSVASRRSARIYAQDATAADARLLSRGAKVDPESLRLSRGHLEWRDGRKHRHAALH